MRSQDVIRFEEELAGAVRASRRPTLAGDYLLQAFDALHQAGDPAHLYGHWRLQSPPDPKAVAAEMGSAARRARVKAARTAVLFCALAAEAYINEFLEVYGVLEEWDRESTPRKYLKGTEAAYKERLFFEDREGYQEIRELFELRHHLVHPKAGFGVTGVHGDPDPEFERLFRLPRVAEYVVMVGGAAHVLVPRAYGFHEFDVPAAVAWMGRGTIREFAQRRKRLPVWDAPAERPLFRQAGDAVMAMKPLPDHADASWTRLRKAREAAAVSEDSTPDPTPGTRRRPRPR